MKKKKKLEFREFCKFLQKNTNLSKSSLNSLVASLRLDLQSLAFLLQGLTFDVRVQYNFYGGCLIRDHLLFAVEHIDVGRHSKFSTGDVTK